MGSTSSNPISVSEIGRAPNRSVLYRLVRSISFSGVDGPTVMIVLPWQIGSLIVGVVMTRPSRAIGPGRSTFAVVNWHQMVFPSSRRVNETPIWLPWLTSGVTLPCWIWPPLKSSRTVPASSRGRMSWSRVSCWPCGSMNWS